MGRPFTERPAWARSTCRPPSGQGYSAIHRDVPWIGLDPLYPRDNLGIALKIEFGITGDVGIGKQAHVGEADRTADEPLAASQMLVHQHERGISAAALGR